MGRLVKFRSYWMSQKTGKGNALRKEKAFLHTLLPDKSMASGGTRPAGFVIQKKHMDNRSTGMVHKDSYLCS